MNTDRPGDREITLDSISERARLEQELARAQEELALINQKLEEKGDFGLGQGASTVYEWEINLALRESAQAKIRSIKGALARLDHGNYGICEMIQPAWKSCLMLGFASGVHVPVAEQSLVERLPHMREPL
jgi:RNA polymerase-binding transcription factor DksA